MKKYFCVLAILCVIGTLSIPSQSSGASQYIITNLGSLGGDYRLSEARGINESGQIVGQVSPIPYVHPGVLWNEDGSMIEFGYFSGIKNTRGLAINESGRVVGDSAVGATTHWAGIKHAFFWENGVMTDLGTLGGEDSRAHGINDSGQVVGQADIPTGSPHAFLWESGIMTDLGTLGGASSNALDINNSGQVVGHANTSTGSTHAFLWENGVMTDLGTLGGANSWALGINDSGQIVGRADHPDGKSHAVLWENGIIIDLGTLPGAKSSKAYDINDYGQIVGFSTLSSGGPVHAIVWENGIMSDLNDLKASGFEAWLLTQAYESNNRGQIVGIGEINGETHGFLATPIATKAIDAVDRLGDTAMIDVFSGDSFTYTIEVSNVFDQLVYFRVQDTLDLHLTYDLGTLTVNGTEVSNSYFSGGALDYEDSNQLIGETEALSLLFTVKVNDLVPGEAHGWMINNAASITAYTSSGDILATMDTNLVQARIENPSENPVPEPTTLLLLGTGLLSILVLARRRRKMRK